jgi:ureidoglycolate lyase
MPSPEPIMNDVQMSSATLRQIVLPVLELTPEAFAPFGQVIAASADGKLYDAEDAQLELGRGIPRFYIMSLKHRPLAFQSITRHLLVTQCLASVGGTPWLVAVAPPLDPDNEAGRPDPAKITAFRVPGAKGIKLHRSTWHAGPFFDTPQLDFFNLELSDTNKIDHHSCRLDREFGLEFRFAEG